MGVRSLDHEYPLVKEMAAHSSTLAWVNPWTEEPVGHSPWCPKSWKRLRTHTHRSRTTSVLSCVFLVQYRSTKDFNYFWLLCFVIPPLCSTVVSFFVVFLLSLTFHILRLFNVYKERLLHIKHSRVICFLNE